jgi:hypothetical protein
MRAKLVKLGMHFPHAILNYLTKWHIQILPRLVVIPFLRHVMLEF